MSWVRTNFDFGRRMRVLTLPRAEICTNREVFDFLRELEGSPLALEEAIQSIIDRFRPDLKGGIVEAMQFNLRQAEWEFIYSHPSFPPVPAFESLPSEQLIQVKLESANEGRDSRPQAAG